MKGFKQYKNGSKGKNPGQAKKKKTHALDGTATGIGI
jgi:hypothetical protein